MNKLILAVLLSVGGLAHAGVEPINVPSSGGSASVDGTAIAPTTVEATGNDSPCLQAGTTGLYVDCTIGSSKVGVGAVNPATKLHMSSGTLLVDGTAGTLKLNASGNVVGTSGSGFIDFNLAGYGAAGTEYIGATVAEQIGYNASGHHAFMNSNNDVVTIGATGVRMASTYPLRLGLRTKAQIDAITPGSEGEMFTCSDCALPYAICVATGTTLSGFRRIDSSTAGCGSGN